MESVLRLYSLPYDEKRPVVCFDELPVQLIGDVVGPLEMKVGKPTRFDYEYKRGGTASLLVAFEPLTGKRLVETSKSFYARYSTKLRPINSYQRVLSR
jgi:hypothetical protein